MAMITDEQQNAIIKDVDGRVAIFHPNIKTKRARNMRIELLVGAMMGVQATLGRDAVPTHWMILFGCGRGDDIKIKE